MSQFQKMLIVILSFTMCLTVYGKNIKHISHNTSNQTVTTQAISAKSVNINTASLEQLQQVKGIGPKKAQAIFDYRQQHGQFKSVEDLDQVKGISTKLADKIDSQVTY